jgi:hypothetical protein
MILWMLACTVSPYSDYWPDKSAYPEITSLNPSVIDGRAGGQVVTISGKHLGNTLTVVVGGRNAEIVSAGPRTVMARLPALPVGPEQLAVSLVTGQGAATRERALSIDAGAPEFWDNEVSSVSVVRVDCPIEGWGVFPDGEEYPYGWCGADMGYASAEAWLGSGPQPGFAGEIGGMTPLSQLPSVGEVRVFGPDERKPPSVPLVFAAHGEREEIRIRTARDFARDIDFIIERQDLLEQTYYWADSISDWPGPWVSLYDDEECWSADLDMVEGGGDELVVDGDASGATSMTMGFGIVEEYEDFTYEDWATTGTASIASVDGSTIKGGPSGIDLGYDMDSGWFLPWGVAGVVGTSDLPSAEYTIDMVNAKGQKRHLGDVEGPTYFDLWDTWPDLTVGYAYVDLDDTLEVSWIPGPEGATPSFVVVEMAVYDTDINDPNWQTQVSRIVAHGDDSTGQLLIAPEDLQALPEAPNQWDEWGEAVGYWGEMTIARHQFRKVKVEGGDMVIDFVHAITGPVFIGREVPAE